MQEPDGQAGEPPPLFIPAVGTKAKAIPRSDRCALIVKIRPIMSCRFEQVWRGNGEQNYTTFTLHFIQSL
jgi:hypothetical protein